MILILFSISEILIFKEQDNHEFRQFYQILFQITDISTNTSQMKTVRRNIR
jgi:hypothetical protein